MRPSGGDGGFCLKLPACKGWGKEEKREKHMWATVNPYMNFLGFRF